MKRAGKCVNKKAYSHKSKALAAARSSYLNRGVKTSIYECPTCLDYHLTSNPRVTYNTEKYFNKWDKEWMKQKYGEFLFLETKLCALYAPSEKTLKNRAKRQRKKANKKLRELELAKPKPNTLSIKEQKAFFASFEPKIYSDVDRKKKLWKNSIAFLKNAMIKVRGNRSGAC